MQNFYVSVKSANEVLDYYEKFLLRCEYVIYIAVVEIKNNELTSVIKEGYGIEIGIRNQGKNIVKEGVNLSEEEIYYGQFCDNTIPTYFPVPMDFEAILKGRFTRDSLKCYTEKYSANVNKENIPSAENQNIRNRIIKTKAQINTTINWIEDSKNRYKKTNKDRPEIINDLCDNDRTINRSYRIKNIKNQKATLGAVFKILEFPNFLFGITNQHLFTYENAKLGDSVEDIDGNKIGNLFWMADDFFKEVALIRMEDDFDENQEKKLPYVIGDPEIGAKVLHNGYGTKGNNREGEIISTNATVRIIDSDDDEEWQVYRKQLLITENTRGGDSGSLVLTLDNRVVGLNFAKTDQRKVILGETGTREFSVANNINLILNNIFQDKQEVFYKKTEDIFIVTTLINQFRTENFIL